MFSGEFSLLKPAFAWVLMDWIGLAIRYTVRDENDQHPSALGFANRERC